MAEIEVSRATMLNMLREVFVVPPGGAKALTSRVRLLGTVGVPRKERREVNKHLTYGLVELTEISMALALMNAHMPPLLAARYVRENWDDFVRLAVSGLNEALSWSVAGEFLPKVSTPVAVIDGNILRTLGSRAKNDRVEELPLGEINLVDDLRGLGTRLPSATAIVLDARTFMPRLMTLMRGFRHSDEDLREMMFRLVLTSNAEVDFTSRN